jgi:hypothetical protein
MLAVLATAVWVAPLPAAASDRDPFWPVGYEASSPSSSSGAAKEEQPLLDLSRLSPEEQAVIKSNMKVGGILEQGASRVAYINNDVVREGDKVSINVHGQSYKFLIRSLQPQNIVLEPVRIEQDEQPQEEEYGA